MQAGGHDVAHAQVPAMAGVFVLPLAADVGNTPLGVEQVDRAASYSKDARRLFLRGRPPRGRRPDIAAQEFEQLRLTGTIVSKQRPAFTRSQLPADVAQHPFVAAPHAQRAQRYGKPVLHALWSSQTPFSSSTRPSRLSLIKCASNVSRAHA